MAKRPTLGAPVFTTSFTGPKAASMSVSRCGASRESDGKNDGGSTLLTEPALELVAVDQGQAQRQRQSRVPPIEAGMQRGVGRTGGRRRRFGHGDPQVGSGSEADGLVLEGLVVLTIPAPPTGVLWKTEAFASVGKV